MTGVDLIVSPHRRTVEVRVPLPPKEVTMSDEPFGQTDIEPQYGISYVDETIWLEHKKKGTTDVLMGWLRDSHYRKLGIKSAKEREYDNAVEYVKSIKRSIERDRATPPNKKEEV